MKRRLGCFVMFVMIFVLAACGGGDGDKLPPGMSGTESGSPEAVEARATFPPTWTPVPTLPTATARPTLDYTYIQPTQPTFIPPTRTPLPAPPTVAPVATAILSTSAAIEPPVTEPRALTVPLALLNQAGQAEFDAGSAPYLAGAPGFNVAPPDTLILLVNMRTEENDPASVATVVIRAQVGVQDGRISLTQTSSNRLGDTAVVQLPLVDRLLDTLETRVDETIRTVFVSSVPGGVDYTVTAVEVIEGAVSLTVSATVQSSGGGQAATPASDSVG